MKPDIDPRKVLIDILDEIDGLILAKIERLCDASECVDNSYGDCVFCSRKIS